MRATRIGPGLLVAAVVGCAVGLPAPAVARARAQAPAPSESSATQDPQHPEPAAALQAWIASEQSSPELMERTVAAMLARRKVGLPLLGRELTAVGDDTESPRARGVKSVATQTALAFLKEQTTSGVIYAGQYDGLQPLRPFVTTLFFGWLLETPDWYPHTHRVHLVPALRDLQTERPDEGTVEGVVAIVEDEALEPRDLRQALSCMLYQWGEKRFIQPRLDELQRQSVEGDAFERVRTLLMLADLHYQLRNYRAAAATHRTLQKVAQDGDVQLKPVDWYWAACLHSLAGQIEHGMAALRRAVELQASPDVDSSHKVERRVWETDPEIDALRQQSGFDALLERALEHSPKPRTKATGPRAGRR